MQRMMNKIRARVGSDRGHFDDGMMDAAALGGKGSARPALAAAVLVAGVLVLLAWLAGSGNGSPAAFAQNTTCVAPTVTVLQTHARHVVVEFDIVNADVAPVSYQVRFKQQTETDYPEQWGSYDVPTDTTLEEAIGGFEGDTVYDLQFRVDCGSDNFSTIVTRQVTTITPICVAPDVSVESIAPTHIQFRMSVEFHGFDQQYFEIRRRLATESTWSGWSSFGVPPDDSRHFIHLAEEEDYVFQFRTRCEDSNQQIVHSREITREASTVARDRAFSLNVLVDGKTTTELAEGDTATVTLRITSAYGGGQKEFKRDHELNLEIDLDPRWNIAIQPGEILVSNGGVAILRAGQLSVSWTLTAVDDGIAHDDDDADDEHTYEYFALTIPPENDEGRSVTVRTGIIAVHDALAFEKRFEANVRLAGNTRLRGSLTAVTESWDDKSFLYDPQGLNTQQGHTYQWLRNGSPIVGETNEVHVVTFDDLNTFLTCRVSFTDADGNAETRLSDRVFIPRGPEITWSSKPAPPSPGQTLSVNTGTITYLDLPPSPTYTYAWYHSTADGLVTTSSELSKSSTLTSSTLTLTNDDFGKYINVAVTYINDVNEPQNLWANALTPAVGGTLLPSQNNKATGTVTISGTEAIGSTLSGTVSNVSDRDGLPGIVEYTYQWLRNGRPIAGATFETYAIAPADVGSRLSLRVFFRDDEYTVEFLTSAQTGFIPARVSNTATGDVTVTGTVEVGQTLTGTAVNVMDDDGIANVSYTYQWLRDGQPIPGATARTYVVELPDIGSKLRFRVRFNDDIGFAESLLSEETATVPSGPVIKYPSGAYIGETISVDTNVITYTDVPSPPAYTHRWIYVDADGTKEGDISDATSSTYTLVDTDDQRYIQVEVSYTSTVTNSSVTRLANSGTPKIAERPPAELAANLSAQVPTNGGSVRLTWSITSTGSELPSKFQYRYKPTMATDYTGDLAQDWEDVSGRGSARSLPITGTLINGVEYTFELRSVDRLGLGTQEVSDTATYRHKTRGCPET